MVAVDLQKRDFVWLVLVVVLVGVGFTYAYGGSSPGTMGHSWEEIEITDEMCNYITGEDCVGDSVSGEGGSEGSGSVEYSYLANNDGDYLDCDDNSVVASWYENKGRCGATKGLAYWKNALSYYGDYSLVKDMFDDAYDENCDSKDNAECNTDTLCSLGGTYRENTEECISDSYIAGSYCISDSYLAKSGGAYLDCEDDSTAASWFKEKGRCGASAGLKYWNDALEEYGDYSLVKDMFDDAYVDSCLTNADTTDSQDCNTAILCSGSGEYQVNTRYCVDSYLC